MSPSCSLSPFTCSLSFSSPLSSFSLSLSPSPPLPLSLSLSLSLLSPLSTSLSLSLSLSLPPSLPLSPPSSPSLQRVHQIQHTSLLVSLRVAVVSVDTSVSPTRQSLLLLTPRRLLSPRQRGSALSRTTTTGFDVWER